MRASERMRIGRRRPHGQAIFFFIVMSQISARLDRASGDAVAANSFFDDDIGILEYFVDPVRGEMIFVNDIAAGIFMDQRRAGLHRGFRIDDRRQYFVIHRHHFDGIFRQITIISDHHRQRLAEIANLIHRQRIELYGPQHRAAADPQRFDMLRDLLAGIHGAHAGHRASRFDIDDFDPRVGAGAAHKRHMQGSRRQQIIDVAPGAGDKALGLFSFDSLADGRIDRKIHSDFQSFASLLRAFCQVFVGCNYPNLRQ